ncbi:MAG: outer membrane protein assembly factor BamB, partial [Gammaproteobacteria bacterium]|nr:outer membrane protein assembly factor BamB [Gammaproteobacteria bacterium]
MRPLLLILSLVALAGCGTFADPTEWFASPDVVEPSPLLDLKNEVQPQTLWSRDVGSGTDDQRLNLQPHAVGDTVYVADGEGQVQALATANGNRRWSVD